MSYRAEVEVLINAVDRASGAFREISDAVEDMTSRFGYLKDVAKTAAGVLLGEVAHDALGALTKSLSQASDNFVDLESTLVRITAAMGKTGDEARRLQNEFLQVAKQQTDLGYTAVEASQALESLVKAGLEGEQAVQALRAALELARIENISTGQAANLLVATLNQFGMSAEDAGKALDVLINASMVGIDSASDFAQGLSYVGTIAHQMGMSIEEVTAALVALNNAGVNASSAGRYLASMLSDMVDKSDKLGFSIYNSDGSMKSLSEIIADLTAKLESFGTQAERDAYLNEIFGEQGRRAVAVLTQQSSSFDDLVAKMEQVGSAAMMVNEIMNTTAGRMAKVNAESQNASLGFGQLTAGIQEAFASFTTLLGPLAQVAQGLGPSILQGAVAGLTAALPSLIANIGGLSAAFTAVSGVISGTIIPLLTNPLTLAIAGVALAVTGLYLAWQNNWFGIRDIAANVVSGLQNLFSGFVDFFKEYWIIFGPAGWVYHAWEENWFGIRDTFNTVVSTIQAGLSGFVSWLTNTIGSGLDTIKTTFEGWGNAINNAISQAVAWWENMLGGFLDWLKGAESAIDDWIKGVSDMFGGWAKGIQDWWSGVVSSLTQPVEAPQIRQPRYGMGMMGIEAPSMQHGGIVPREGLYWLHPGEVVVPAETPINVTINLNVSGAPGMDVRQLADEAARRVEQRLRSVLIESTSRAAQTKRIRLGA